MTEIFMSGYNYGSYEDYAQVNLRAFATEPEALEFNEKHKAEYQHSVRNEVPMREFMRDWQLANPYPRDKFAVVTMKSPQWEGKKGSKKNATPEVLGEFKKREQAYADEAYRVGQINKRLGDEWCTAAIVALKTKMAELGCTQAEIDAQSEFYIRSDEEREYTVEAIPFGPEATDA